jgi:hypothetical protein
MNAGSSKKRSQRLSEAESFKKRRVNKWVKSDGEGMAGNSSTWKLYDPVEVPMITQDNHHDPTGVSGIPGNVRLGERALLEILKADVEATECGRLWSDDFSSTGEVKADRARSDSRPAKSETGETMTVTGSDGKELLLRGCMSVEKARGLGLEMWEPPKGKGKNGTFHSRLNALPSQKQWGRLERDDEVTSNKLMIPL